MSTSTIHVLQQAYILATGHAATAAMLSEFEAMVQHDGGYAGICALVEGHMEHVAARDGLAATVRALALNGLGYVLTDEEALSVHDSLAAQGVDTWAKIFEFCIQLQGGLGDVLDNRATVADAFNTALASAGKAALFSGATVDAAVHHMLQGVGAGAASLANGLAGVEAIAANLGAQGLQARAADGYLAGADVYVDADGDGVLEASEFVTQTGADGSFTLPAGHAAGTVHVVGGTDLLTGATFHGSVSALTGVVVNPFTTMIQAMVHGGQAASVEQAVSALGFALGLPDSINLQAYDPLDVLADAAATADDKALALHMLTRMLQLSNVMTQLSSAIEAQAGGGNADAAVAAALAGAIRDAHDSGGNLDLADAALLAGIVAQTSGTGSLAENAALVAQVIAASNAAAGAATSVHELAQVAVVAQGEVVAGLEEAAVTGDFDGAVDAWTGDALDALVAGADPGELAPGVPVPPPPGPGAGGGSPFSVSVPGGVVRFGGSATGDITVSWSGTPGDSVATFARGGFTATNLPDFSGSASSIDLDAGENLLVDASQITGVTVNGLGTVTLTDTSLAAADLNALDATIGATLVVTSLTTLTGAAADLTASYAANAAGTISGLGDESVVVSGGIAVATANAADSATSGIVTATITDGDLATLGSLTGSGNAYSITVTDTSAAASALTALDGKTTVAVTATAVATITGSAPEIVAAINAAGIATSTGYAAAVTGSASVADVNTIDADTSGVVTATLAEGDAASLAALTGTGNAYAITLTDSAAAATALTALDGKTTVTVNAAAVGTLTGTATEVIAAINAPGIATSAGYAATVSGSTSVTNANTIDADTTGVVSATLAEGGLATLATLTGTGNAYTVTVTDTTVAAAGLTGLDAKTTVAVGASAAGTLTGTAAEVTAAYAAAAAGTIAGLGNEQVTLSGTTSVADANTVDAATSGIVTAAIPGASAATLLTLTGNNAYALTVTDTSVLASQLNTLRGGAALYGTVDATAATAIGGTAADFMQLIGDGNISTASSYAANVTGSVTVSVANTIDADTTGVVTATLSQGALADLVTLTGTGNAYTVTVTDTTASAGNLVTVDGKTTVAVGAAGVNTLTGTAAQVVAAYAAQAAGTITGLGNEAVTVTGGASVADANTIAAATTGTVSVAISDGALATLLTLAESGHAYAATVTDAAVSASDLSTLDGKTTAVVDASAVTTLAGTASAVGTALGSTGIGGLGDAAVTLSDTTLAATALTAIDGATTGVVDASGLTLLTGTAVAVKAALAANTAGTVSGLGGVAVQLSDTTVAAADLNLINAATSEPVTASSATTVTGTLADVVAAYTANSGGDIAGLGDEGIVLSDATLAAASLVNLLGATSGQLDVSAASAVTGTAADVAATYASARITGLGNETVTLTGVAAAADLLSIDSLTSVAVDATGVTGITGTTADVLAVIAASGITTAANYTVTLSDTPSIASANLIDADTTGVITATLAANSAANLSTLTGTGNAYTVTVNSATASVDHLNTINAATTVAVDVSAVTTVNGFASTLSSFYSATGFSGLGNETVVTTDTAFVFASHLIALDAATTGVVDATAGHLQGTVADALTVLGSPGITLSSAVDISPTGTTATGPQAASLFAYATTGETFVILVSTYTSGSTIAMDPGDTLRISPNSSYLTTPVGGAGAVDADGEYYFGSGVFTWWDMGLRSIGITGVSSVTVEYGIQLIGV